MTLYVDVPFELIFAGFRLSKPGTMTNCNDAVKSVLNVQTAKFICNSCAKISKGDLFLIELRPDDSELLFVLRTGCTLVNPQLVNDYLAKKVKQKLTS